MCVKDSPQSTFILTQAMGGGKTHNMIALPVCWAILHVIDHTALHLGHMQLTRQLWQGGRAAAGPRWFQRLG